MSKHKFVTMEDLGLTPGEAQILADGSRHLFGAPKSTDETEAEEPPPARPKTAKTTQKPAPAPAPALSGLAVKGGSSPGKHPNPKKGNGFQA